VKASELADILVVARAAAREAGRIVHAAHRRHPVVEHKGAVDLVTRFDRESEELLRARLAALSLDIVGEEQGGTWDRARPTLFIDPIDGTTNFVHGHPFWCVSIGLVEEEEPTLGVVLAPALGLEWYGWLAEGGAREATRSAWGAARADGEALAEPCVPSGVARLDDALLATGFPYDRRTSADNNFDAFFALKQRCQAVRRCGSAALDLCLVADGTYDGYWERKLKPWDIAGGIALVRAAGGEVTDLDGRKGTGGCIPSGRVLATNGLIHAAVAEALAASGRRSIP
jgi:myo-inositol-1(or 4)-monophosphatase